MISTAHFLLGGAIGAAASARLDPTLAVPVALGCGAVSHHLLDALPHTDAGTFWPEGSKVPLRVVLLVGCEFVLGAALVATLYLSYHTSAAFLAGALAGMLPDFFDEIPLWSGLFRRTALGGAWHRWHTRLHCADMTAHWRAGVALQALVVVASLLYLLAPAAG